MLPGKTYTFDDVVSIALRRKWWVVVPFLLGCVVAYAVGKRTPFDYQADTLIMQMPPRVGYGQSSTLSLEDRLTTISQQVLSRARLEQIIVDFNLYGPLREALPMEEVVKRMRANDIRIKMEAKNSFRLGYQGYDPNTVQQVAARLGSLFIEKDERDRENLTEDTNQFLDVELEDARRRLVDHEKKVEEYRRRYSTQLPSQAAANLQSLQNAQVQLQMLGEASNRDHERRLVLERQLADLQSPDAAGPVAAASPEGSTTPESPILQKLEAAQAQLHALQLRLKPDHPDVKMAERTIRDLQAELEASVQQTPSTPAPTRTTAAVAPSATLRQRRVQEVTALIADIERQLQAKQEQEKHLRDVIAEHQSDLDAAPTRESELVELNRDYASLQNAYSTLLQKRQEWKIATNLERKSLGDQFKVLEPAAVPERPVGSKRMKIYMIGAGLSLVVGLLLALLLEYLDTSFRTKSDIEEVLKLPVLGSVPVMATKAR